MTDTATKHHKFFEALRQYGVIPTLVTVLPSGDNDSLRILICKALSVFAEDPSGRELIRLAGGILPVLNLLRSRNEFVQLQATLYFSLFLFLPLILLHTITNTMIHYQLTSPTVISLKGSFTCT
jgi:hypothetical protein